MGKHNGKARKTGITVGNALVNKARKDGRTGSAAAYIHTTDYGKSFGNMQSVIESNDLQEMMNMAELADRDFAGQRGEVVVLSTGAVDPMDAERAVVARADAETRHRHRLCIPRRPGWSPAMTPEALDAQERAAFLDWRRDLALLESEEHLVLTPFEKNLEVWRQLWRVVERSDAIVQVVDVRDPLTYRSEDLEEYCHETHPTKRCMILLNKADLLPERLRSAWADYFDSLGLKYAFWSAKAAIDELTDKEGPEGSSSAHDECTDPRAKLLSVDELHELMEAEGEAAAAEADKLGLPRASRGDRVVVGLIGYPNVGKSSTINALFGSKKTAVAPTPGKTKHFQTLNVSDTLCLCDCPGLVMPQFAHSKAEMVAAGVIPIDRLTDVRAPIATVAERVSREQFIRVYGLRLPPVPPGEDPDKPPSPAELLRALGRSRGWIGSSGQPDETRAGRRILKDFVDGRILACKPPPDASPEIIALVEEIGGRRLALDHRPKTQAQVLASVAEGSNEAAEGYSSDPDSLEGETEGEEDPAGPARALAAGEAAVFDDADLDLLESLNLAAGKTKPVRAPHKFKKKAPKVKGRATYIPIGDGLDGKDGDSVPFGKRGGLVRAV